MKCANCGAEIRVGCVYCSVCGHEAQIVSDYSVLEDDLLKSMLEDERKKNVQKNTVQEMKTPQKKKKKNLPLIISVIAIACILIGLTVFLAVREYRNNSFDYQYTQGMIAKGNKDYKRAISYLQRAIELEEKNTDVMMELAKIYELNGNDDAGERMLQNVLKLEPEHRDAYKQLLVLYDSQEKYGKITDLYEELKDTDLADLFADYIVMPPEFSEEEGTYEEEMEIMILAQPGCTIYYAFGDTDPVSSGREYDGSITLKEGVTKISAVAKDERGIYSEVVLAEFEIEFQAPDAPYVFPSSGTYTEEQKITITIPKNCNVYYTWDGSAPDKSSAKYEAPLDMPAGNNVLSVIAYDDHDLCSRVTRYSYIYHPQVEE